MLEFQSNAGRKERIVGLAMKVRDLIKMLNDDGWRQVRMRGSHRQFRHSSKPGTITVAGNYNIDIPREHCEHLETGRSEPDGG